MILVRSPQEWGDAYEEVESAYDRFAARIEELLRNLMDDGEIDYVWTNRATLSVDDFVDEIYINERDGISVTDPFATRAFHVAEVRVVTKTKADSLGVCELLEREFEVDAELSMTFDAAEASNVRMEEPGYLGRIAYDFPRIVVSLTAARLGLPEWEEFEGMRAVVEVPSLMQRTWFEIDRHLLPHVSDASYPSEVRETIARAAALFAQAEAEIAEIPLLSERVEQEYERAIHEGDLDLELNMNSLHTYLRDSRAISHLQAVAQEAGMEEGPELPLADEGDLWTIRRCGCATVRDLDQFAREAEARAKDVLTQLCELIYEEDEFVPMAFAEHVIVWLLLILRRADATVVSLTRFRPSIERSLNVLIGNEIAE